MKIVKFNNGTYGIRRWFFGYQFKDLETAFWWRVGSKWIMHCQGEKEKVIEIFNQKTDYGVPEELCK